MQVFYVIVYKPPASLEKILVKSGISKAQAKQWISQKPSPQELADLYFEQSYARIEDMLQDYSAENGTAINLAGTTIRDTKPTGQQINVQVIAGGKGNPPNRSGMDGSGDYYAQSDFEISDLVVDVNLEYSKTENIRQKLSYEASQLNNKINDTLAESTDLSPLREKRLTEAASYTRKLSNKFSAFANPNSYYIQDVDILAGQYRSEYNYSNYKENNPKYPGDIVWNISRADASNPNNYKYYTAQMPWAQNGINYANFAIYGVAPKQNEFALQAVAANGQMLNLPTPQAVDKLYILAAAANGNQTGDFIIDYSDGTYDKISAGFTDWANNGNKSLDTADLYPNESEVVSFSQYISQDGGTRNGTRYMFGYVLDLNEDLEVSTIQLPNNENIKIFAASYV